MDCRSRKAQAMKLCYSGTNIIKSINKVFNGLADKDSYNFQ
jgi:hypothetical protein